MTRRGNHKKYYNALKPEAKYIIIDDINEGTKSKQNRAMNSIDTSW
jgi:hypothetical protein